MTRYLHIVPNQEPFELGTDDNRRSQYAFNVLAACRPSNAFLGELVAVLESAGVGIDGVTIFAGATAVIPDGDGPFLVVRATGGTSPVGTHNDGQAAYRRPGAQVVARARTTHAAEVLAYAAYAALAAVRNEAVNA